MVIMFQPAQKEDEIQCSIAALIEKGKFCLALVSESAGGSFAISIDLPYKDYNSVSEDMLFIAGCRRNFQV